MSGLDRLLKLDIFPYGGARVGLLCHHASVTEDGRHITDVLAARKDWHLTCIFTPEHGFAGTAAAGETVSHSNHPQTGLPIYSLYGETRTPKPEWLEEVDLVVIDLMDLGVRCYTYASTLMEMMQQCAGMNVPVLVLDRPTPLQDVVDGPGLDDDCRSFVGQVPLPLVYGKSQGELATYLKETLPDLQPLTLSVLPSLWSEAPRWIPPSPAIGSPEAAACYPITVWSEAIPGVWVDRGGPSSFQVWAMPDFPSQAFEYEEQEGYRCEPASFSTPEGQWSGLRFTRVGRSECKPVSLAHHLLSTLCNTLGPERLFGGDEARPEFFDQLAGTRNWRQCLINNTTPDFLQ